MTSVLAPWTPPTQMPSLREGLNMRLGWAVGAQSEESTEAGDGT